jgi:arylformamidase
MNSDENSPITPYHLHMKWQSMDLKMLEREYSPSSMIGGNYQPFVQSYVDLSAKAYNECVCKRDVRYGPEPRALLDFFPVAANPEADLLVFIHGGYWQELSRTESALLAPAWTSTGRAQCVIGYDLAPQATIAQIIQQCQRALVFLVQQAETLGFNPKKIVIAGSSAGAHMAAMLCLINHLESEPIAKLRGTVNVPLMGGVLLSGIYDLEPLVPTYINAALGLTDLEARRLSPLQLLKDHSSAKHLPPLLIAYGENETLEFKRQSAEFSAKLGTLNSPFRTLEVAGCNHFDILNALGDAHSELFHQAIQLFETSAV